MAAMVCTAIRSVVFVLSRLEANSGEMMLIGRFRFGGEASSNSDDEDLLGDAGSKSDTSAPAPHLLDAFLANSFLFRASSAATFSLFLFTFLSNTLSKEPSVAFLTANWSSRKTLSSWQVTRVLQSWWRRSKVLLRVVWNSFSFFH